MAERKTAHFPDFHLPHPDLKILRNPRFLLSVLGLGGLTGTFIGIKHIQDELNKTPAPRSQTIDTPPSFAPAVVPIATVTATPLKPTPESSPTKESPEISIDQSANLFASPDSRATFQPYDPSFKVTKDTIIGQFGDFIQVKGEKSNSFLPKQSAQNLPAGLKELTPDQISQWPIVADLKSKDKDAGNITVSDVFKINVNLKEKEGLTLTDTNGNILLIQVDANSQLSFQSKQGPNIMTAKVGQPGEYNRGTLRIDLKNQKVTFYDTSGKPVVQNVPIDRNVPANPVLLFPDRRIQTAKLNASGDSNAQTSVTPDGRYIDPKTRIPTATAVLPTPENTRVPAPATVPATVPTRPAAATPTQKPAEATATTIPAPEQNQQVEIGNLETDGFTIVTVGGGKYEIVVSPNTIGVPPGQNPTEANLQFVKDMVKKYNPNVKIKIKWTNNLQNYPYLDKATLKIGSTGYYRYAERNGNSITVFMAPTPNFDIRSTGVFINGDINWTLVDVLVDDLNSAMIGSSPQNRIPDELDMIVHPSKFGIIQRQ